MARSRRSRRTYDPARRSPPQQRRATFNPLKYRPIPRLPLPALPTTKERRKVARRIARAKHRLVKAVNPFTYSFDPYAMPARGRLPNQRRAMREDRQLRRGCKPRPNNRQASARGAGRSRAFIPWCRK